MELRASECVRNESSTGFDRMKLRLRPADRIATPGTTLGFLSNDRHLTWATRACSTAKHAPSPPRGAGSSADGSEAAASRSKPRGSLITYSDPLSVHSDGGGPSKPNQSAPELGPEAASSSVRRALLMVDSRMVILKHHIGNSF